MYIHPFWCGVAATILAEIGALVITTIILNIAKNKKEDK